MNILLTGYYGFGNFGDDLLLICTHSIVRKYFPDASISVFANFTSNLSGYSQRSNYIQYINRLVDSNVRLIDWTSEEYFDLIIHGGGGTFFDDPEKSFLNAIINACIRFIGTPRYSKLIRLLRFLIRRPAHLTAGCRLGIGIGLGPYPIQGNRFKRESVILGEFDRLAVRDSESYSLAEKLGIYDKTKSFTDLVFYMSKWLSIQPNEYIKREAIGLVICQGKSGNEHLIDITTCIAQEQNTKMLYIFLDENHDHKLIEQCVKTGKRVLVWRPWNMTITDFIEQLSVCKILITNRAHGAIVGACIGVPSLCIATDAKIIAVQKMISNGSKLVDQPITQDKLIGVLSDVLTNLSIYCAGLEIDVSLQRTEAQKMVEYVFG